MLRFVRLVLPLLLLAGCASETMENKVATLHRGMTRADVIARLGQPAHVTSEGDIDMLHFVVPRTHSPQPYAFYVAIGLDGIVEAIGPDDEPGRAKAVHDSAASVHPMTHDYGIIGTTRTRRSTGHKTRTHVAQ